MAPHAPDERAPKPDALRFKVARRVQRPQHAHRVPAGRAQAAGAGAGAGLAPWAAGAGQRRRDRAVPPPHLSLPLRRLQRSSDSRAGSMSRRRSTRYTVVQRLAASASSMPPCSAGGAERGAEHALPAPRDGVSLQRPAGWAAERRAAAWPLTWRTKKLTSAMCTPTSTRPPSSQRTLNASSTSVQPGGSMLRRIGGRHRESARSSARGQPLPTRSPATCCTGSGAAPPGLRTRLPTCRSGSRRPAGPAWQPPPLAGNGTARCWPPAAAPAARPR